MIQNGYKHLNEVESIINSIKMPPIELEKKIIITII